MQYEQHDEELVPYDLTHRLEWAHAVANGALGQPLDPYQEYTMVRNMGTVPVLLYHNTNSNWPNPAFSRVVLPGHWIEVVDLDTLTQPRIWVDSAVYSQSAECEILQVGYQNWEPEEPKEFCDAWAVGHYLQDGVMTKHYPEAWAWANVANLIVGNGHFAADVAGVAADDYWLVGYDGGAAPANQIFAHWDGVAWTELGGLEGPPQYGVWGFATDDFWSVGGPTGNDGQIWHWDGVNWSHDCTPEPQYGNTYYCVHGNIPTNIFAGGTNESIVWYTGAAWVVDWGNPEGLTWYGTATVPSGLTSWVCGGTAPWLGAPGGFGAIFRRIGPLMWVPDLINIPEPPTLRAMWAFSPNEAWAVGDGGTLLHWTGGPMWMVVPDPFEGQFDYRGVFGCWPWGVWAIGQDEATGDNVIIFWDGIAWVPVHGPNLTEGELLGLKGVWVGVGPV